jgi:hypothetical protein
MISYLSFAPAEGTPYLNNLSAFWVIYYSLAAACLTILSEEENHLLGVTMTVLVLLRKLSPTFCAACYTGSW